MTETSTTDQYPDHDRREVRRLVWAGARVVRGLVSAGEVTTWRQAFRAVPLASALALDAVCTAIAAGWVRRDGDRLLPVEETR